jgi:hypothetical protein
MLSVQDVITDAGSLIDFAQFGEAPEAEYELLAVRTLNGLLGEWSTKRWINPKQLVKSCTPANAQFVVMGTDLTTGETPDIKADFMSLQKVTALNGSIVYSLTAISLAEWEALSVKTVRAIPAVYAFDYQQPIAKIFLFPQMNTGMTITVTGTPKLKLTGAQSMIDLDDTYYEAVVYNLACRLYPHLKRDAGLDKEIFYTARASLHGLRARAIRMRAQKAKTGIGSGGNTGSGYWMSNLNTVTQ